MKNIHIELWQGVESTVYLAMGSTQGYQPCLDRIRMMVRFEREDERSLLVEWNEFDDLLFSYVRSVNAQVRETAKNTMIGLFYSEPLLLGPARRLSRS